jgi:small-conductance mechanosensitive channel
MRIAKLFSRVVVLAPAVLAWHFCCGLAVAQTLGVGPLPTSPDKVAESRSPESEKGAAPAPDDEKLKTESADAQGSEKKSDLPAAAAPTPEKELEAKREKVAEEIRVAQRELAAAKASGEEDSEPNKPLARKPDLLKTRDSLLAQRQAVAARHEELLRSLASARKRSERGIEDLPDEGPPYSFLLLEQLRDSLNTAQARDEMNEAAVAAAQDALKQSRSEVEEKQSQRALAKEAVRNNKDPGAAAELQTALEVAELEADVAREELQLREAELAAEKLALEVNQLRIRTTQAKLEVVAKSVAFTRDDLQERLAALDAKEAELKQTLQMLGPGSMAVRLVEQQWLDARGRHEAAPQRTPALSEEAGAWRRGRQTQQQQVASANRQLLRLGGMREAWNRRYATFNGDNHRDELAKWHEETEWAVEQLNREARLDTIRVDQLRKEMAALEDRARRADRQAPEVAKWIGQQRHEINQLLAVYEADRLQLEEARRLNETLLAEIRERTSVRSVRDMWEDSWRVVRQGWNFVLTTAGTNESPITVGKVVSGVLLVVLGYLMARWMSRIFAGRLPRRFGVTQNAAAAMESLSFYVLVAMFTVMALYYVDVPLTAFTIAGGAVALGVGFGSQNIMNNFISGLILLAEQPIRVGDQIQVEGMSARVEHIGARSTRVRTPSNQEIIVPNSSFLQNNVVNWTLSDTNVRGDIKLGVAYGSDLEEVRRTLLASATEHELVMAQPAPFIWLVDFGDNAIEFELHFWIHMASSTQRRQIESDIRFIIDRRFREKNLVIAYPQRDIHLNTTQPLAVHLLGADEVEQATQLGGRAAA